VTEFAVGLLLAPNRKITRVYNRTCDGNCELDSLMGFDLVGRTVAVIGTGKIGTIFARIMAGFGCTVIGFVVHHSPELEKNRRRFRRGRGDAGSSGRHLLAMSVDSAVPSHRQ